MCWVKNSTFLNLILVQNYLKIMVHICLEIMKYIVKDKTPALLLLVSCLETFLLKILL